MTDSIVRLCTSYGIETTYVDVDGIERTVSDETLRALVDAFGIKAPAAKPPAGIDEALLEATPPQCYVPDTLTLSRAWGLTCQLQGLASARNLGIGDFADLEDLCRIAGAAGADFIGLNPLHAMFWSDPSRYSPFSPSNRNMLNPLYLAADWIDGFCGLRDEEAYEAARLRETALVDHPAVSKLKDGILRRLFARFQATGVSRSEYDAFCNRGGEQLLTHAWFETVSWSMVEKGCGAGWLDWPEALRNRHGETVRQIIADDAGEVGYHLWLQWQADRQLARVCKSARKAGMRIGLYLDLAVGVSADGSATWTDPDLVIPNLSVGAPPDSFSTGGQDWGLAPMSPTLLAEYDGEPFADTLAAVMRHAGALRIDHAMSMARLWLIPNGMPARAGAYVRYPLMRLLAKLAAASCQNDCIVIGEDLGVVPRGFRTLMARRHFHGYRVFYFEFDANRAFNSGNWSTDALACIATHDMPTFAGWWSMRDLDMRESLGLLTDKSLRDTRTGRVAERQALQRLLGEASNDPAVLSPKLHNFAARCPCRLFAVQVEDALGLVEQVNIPTTIDEHPNWRRRLPVSIEHIASHPGFQAHTAAVSRARPR
ncbi:MAG: 4-alpha-glucanotransferase [Alphaproteobacteria bacterium]